MARWLARLVLAGMTILSWCFLAYHHVIELDGKAVLALTVVILAWVNGKLNAVLERYIAPIFDRLGVKPHE